MLGSACRGITAGGAAVTESCDQVPAAKDGQYLSTLAMITIHDTSNGCLDRCQRWIEQI